MTQTFQKVLLNGIPSCLMLRETKKESEAFVGTRNGAVLTINTLDIEQRARY